MDTLTEGFELPIRGGCVCIHAMVSPSHPQGVVAFCEMHPFIGPYWRYCGSHCPDYEAPSIAGQFICKFYPALTSMFCGNTDVSSAQRSRDHSKEHSQDAAFYEGWLSMNVEFHKIDWENGGANFLNRKIMFMTI